MNHKQSKQRTRLLEMLRKHYGHLSAEQVYNRLKDEDKRISLATVYRNLNLLASQNLINKIEHPTVGSMYDGREYPHYHLHCEACDGLIDIEGLFLEELNDKVEKQMKARVLTHRIVFEGICEACLRNGSNVDGHLT